MITIQKFSNAFADIIRIIAIEVKCFWMVREEREGERKRARGSAIHTNTHTQKARNRAKYVHNTAV